MNRMLAIATLVWASTASAQDASFNAGVAAYARGDYETAAQTLIPLAETADHPYAQRFLAEMYAKGQGVEQNYPQAVKWYRGAAEKGVDAAQYKLGLMYRDGQGVPQDMEYAYAWLSVAAKQGNRFAPTALASVEGQLSAEEMSQARKLSEDFMRKYGEPPKLTPEGITESIRQQ
ncbi:MAG: tetratricopeptide repeat protein [Chromatiales bacterium]